MTKELIPLEALESINEIECGYSEAKHGILTPKDICPVEFSIIETALKDYETLKLKGEEIKEYRSYSHEQFVQERKQLKAFEIIKKIICITSDDFFEETIGFKKVELTKQEFDLLKEVLKNESNFN